MQAKDIVKLTEELAMPVLSENGLEFVDCEFVKEGPEFYLRLYIDKEGGVSINECERMYPIFYAVLTKGIEQSISQMSIIITNCINELNTLKENKTLSEFFLTEKNFVSYEIFIGLFGNCLCYSSLVVVSSDIFTILSSTSILPQNSQMMIFLCI